MPQPHDPKAEGGLHLEALGLGWLAPKEHLRVFLNRNALLLIDLPKIQGEADRTRHKGAFKKKQTFLKPRTQVRFWCLNAQMVSQLKQTYSGECH
jgi:hypothetical protein